MFFLLERIRKIITSLSRRSLLFAILIGVALVLIFSTSVFLLEKNSNEGFSNFGDSIWWIIVTFTTIGYGDIAPITPLGRIIAVIGILIGVGFLAMVLGLIANYIFNLIERRKKGMQTINSTNHILICGWNKEEGINVLKELIADKKFESVAIIAELDEHPALDINQASFVKGSAADKRVLEKANAGKAKAALIFAKDSLDPASDGQTVLSAMNLKSLKKDIYICAELVEDGNEDYLRKAGCNSVIDITRVGSNLMVQAIQNPGVSEVISDLLSNRVGNEFYRVPVTQKIQGRRIRDIINQYENFVILGYERNGKKVINPEKDSMIEKDDYLFVIAENRPDFQ